MEKIPTLYFISKESFGFEETSKKQRGNKGKEQRNRKREQPQYFRSTRSENAE